MGWSWTQSTSKTVHGPRALWLSLNSSDGERQRASSCAQAPREVVTIPSMLATPGWPEQRDNVVAAGGSSQSRRNVLLYGREEITAKECAVPRPGLGERKRRQTSRQEK